MKIINLKAENFKKLEAVDITPEGSTVVLTGANAQGKSSVLDAIWAAFSGRFAKSVKKPIKDGSLLDSKSMQIINEMAGTNDYQVWIERVDESGKVGFYIEDGNVTAVNGEVAAQAGSRQITHS